MKIIVYPNLCRVEGANQELYYLRDKLTFDVPGAKYTAVYRKKIWDGKKRFFNLMAKTFAVGLLGYVKECCKDLQVVIEDTREYKHIDTSLPELSIESIKEGRRKYQGDVVLKCLESKNCIIEAATNAGKTVMFSVLIKKLQPMNVLILIHREEILWQIRNEVQKITGLQVGIITAKDVLIKPVTVAMVTTLLNRIGAYQDITDYFNSVQCIIVDEAHHAKAESYSKILANCKATYRFGFSGTIPKEDTYNGILTRMHLGSVVFKISNDELILKGVSAKPKVHIYEIESSSKLSNVFNHAKSNLELKKPKGFTNQDLMKEVYRLSVELGIVNNEERNSKTLDVIQNNTNKSVLIVVDLLEHGQIVEKMLNSNGVNAIFISGNSEVRESAFNLFKAGKLKVLISTNIIDEGVDISRIEVLIMLAGKKSRRQLLQRVGRSLRSKEEENVVKIYDFMDFGSRYLEKHARERLKIYKEEKFEIEFI